MIAMPSVIPPMDFWQTARGEKVRSYFEAYGDVVRCREATGDPTAVPSPDGPMMGGGRSAPSNVSDVLLKHMDVSRFLDRNVTRRQAALVNFIYVDGVDYLTRIQYEFTDGSRSEWLEESHEKPLVPVSHIHTESRKEYVYDLMKFECPELEEVAKLWKTSKVTLLRREHIRLAKNFASFAKL